jgi:MoaD family protein
MEVTIRSFLTLRQAILNQAELKMQVGSITLRELLDELCRQFGKNLADQMFDTETGELSRMLKILVNGRHYTTLPKKLETTLAPGDEVALFPPLAGG